MDLKTSQYVELISSFGQVVNSINGVSFTTYSAASDYLYSSQFTSFRNKRYLNLNRFSIVQLELEVKKMFEMDNQVEKTIIADSEEPLNQEWFKAIVYQSVLNGFNEMDSALLNFALTDDKYHSILVEYVPPHMLYSLDEFMSDGINSCDLDILGSISLTASQKQLTMYEIDRLFLVKTDKTSK
jgi:hypothetical protein